MESKNISLESDSNDKKIRASAYENWQYARENDLFLSLETADYLNYHQKIAEAEYESLSAPDKSLSHEHLELLRIPPVNIKEQWTVPLRIAGILEDVCGNFSDDNMEMMEDELRSMPKHKSLLMEEPFLYPSHDEDCAELQYTVSDIISSDIRNVRNHGLPVAKDGGSSIPEDAGSLAKKIEDNLKTETLTVSEQTIRIMSQLMESMKRTDKDHANLIQEELEYKPVRIQITPHLTPVSLPADYRVAEGDVCITSDISDLSSHMSEALEEAESIVNKKAGDIWLADDKSRSLGVSEEAPAFVDDLSWPTSPNANLLIDLDDEPMLEPYSNSSPLQPEQNCESYRVTNNTSELQLAELLADDSIAEGSMAPPFIDSLPVAHYEEFLTEGLADNDHNAFVASQAQIPLPDTEIEPEVSRRETVALDATGLFQWYMEKYKEAFDFETWQAPEGHHDKLARTISPAISDLKSPEEIFEGDTYFEEKLERLLPDMTPPDHTWLMSSIQHPEDYDIMEQFPDEPMDEPVDVISATDDSTWATLIHRRKRRKVDGREPQNIGTGQEAVDVPDKTLFKAPELLLGVSAFSHLQRQQAKKPIEKSSAVYSEMADLIVSESTTDISMPGPLVNTANTPSNVVLSTAIPLPIRTHILRLLPNLKYVERDYQSQSGHSVADDEADIVSLSTGLIMTTMVGLRQSGAGQKMSTFQQRIPTMSGKYGKLCILVYRSQRLGVKGDSISEFSPSDALAFAQLQGLAHNLSTDVSILYISRGERMVAQWAASLLCMNPAPNGSGTEALLMEAEIPQELFLRRMGLNVYDAQVVLRLLGVTGKSTATQIQSSISEFVAMPPDEKSRRFGPHVGCPRALEKATNGIQAQR